MLLLGSGHVTSHDLYLYLYLYLWSSGQIPTSFKNHSETIQYCPNICSFTVIFVETLWNIWMEYASWRIDSICDDSRLVFKCMQIHQFIATQLPCYYSFVIKMPLKNHVKYVWKQEVPLPQQRLLLCIHVRGGHQRPTQAYRPQIFYYLLSLSLLNAAA